MMKIIEDYIREFVYYVYMEKNYSKKTANTYKINLGDFVTYLQTEEERTHVQINDIHKDNIKNYIAYLKNDVKNKPR